MALPDEATAVARLQQAGYLPQFEQVFGDRSPAISLQTIAEAIAAFERSLIGDDRFNAYLKGDSQALSQAEKQGLQAFMQTGCYGCHNGALLGGSSFQKIGLAKPFPNTRDLGRFLITGAAADKFVFKVPSLRDVSRSAPYFHDGSAKTLEQAIVAMAWHQLGISLDAERVASIATFLRALENTKRLQ